MIPVNVLAVIAYLLFTLYLLKRFKRHLVFFGYFSFMSTWALISCFYNDLGIFNLELFRLTETTYATSRLAGFYIVFNLGFLFMGRILERRPLARIDYAVAKGKLNLGHFKFAAYAAVALIIAFIAYAFLTEGIPVLTGFNRIEYFKQASPLERNLVIYGSLLAFILGFYRRKRKRYAVNDFLIAAYILFAVAIGHKFSLLITLLISYFAPVYIRHVSENPRLRLFTLKRVLALSVVVVAFVMFTFVVYYFVLKDFGRSSTLLVNRVFAFQGQMWWSTDYDISHEGRYDRGHWRVELDNILSPEDMPEGKVGMKYMMVKTLGPEKAYEIFDKGYLYTHTYPAILIATFPMGIAVFIQFLAGMFFFVILYYLYYSIIYRHALRSIITLLIVIPYVSVLFSGNFATLLTPGLVAKLAILGLLEMGAARRSPSAAADNPDDSG